MRPLALVLPLVLSLNAVCLAAPAPAADWVSSSSLEGFTELSAADRRRIAPLVKNKIVSYSFEEPSTEWRIHRGDLAIAGNFDNEGALIVDGSLRIAGSYDDFGSGTGLLIVLGDLEAENVFSWDALYVRGAVRASGLIYGAYNDYAFEVDGGVSARGIVMDDHSADYRVERAEFDLDNNETATEEPYGKMLRLLVPEVLAVPGMLELGEDSSLFSLWPAYQPTKDLVRSGQPIFRAKEAPPGLVDDARIAVAAASGDAQLLPLVGRDPLTDQLIAARPNLSQKLIAALLAGKDPGARAWLAGQVTDLAQLGGGAGLTVGIAERLVANPQTPETTLRGIAESADPAVRRTLAQRENLPEALLAKLVKDPSGDLRASVLSNFDNAERLPAAEKARLAKDPEAGVREALARVPLPYEVARGLAADPSPEVRMAFAVTLAGEIDHPFPAIAAAQREELAASVFAAAGDEDGIASAIFPALPPARQEELFLAEGRGGEKKLDWILIAPNTRSLPVLRLLYEKTQDLDVQGGLAVNPALPVDLQLGMVARAAAAKPRKLCETCEYVPSPFDVVARLVGGNGNAAPAALVEAARLSLQKPDDLLVDSVNNNTDIPLAGLELLDAKGAGTESWSLFVLSKRFASRPMLERALPRWYETEEAAAAIGQMRGLDDAGWWLALAQSPLDGLRDAAAWNINTPPAQLVKLLDDPSPQVAAIAAGNPALPASALPLLEKKDPFLLVMSPVLPLAELAEKTRSAASPDVRRQALEMYLQRHNRSW